MNTYDLTSTDNFDFFCTTKDLLHLKKAISKFFPHTGSDLDDFYVGTWHRIFENGTSHPVSANVIWLQTHKFFADIRIPAGSREKQMSFAGHTVIKGDRCEWHQWCGLLPSVSDTARLQCSHDTLQIKEYCDDGATEVWEKEDKKVERIMSLQFIDEQDIANVTSVYDCSKQGKGFFLVVGDNFMRVLGDSEEGDFESYYGNITALGDWLVSYSTVAASEGYALYHSPVMRQFGDIIIEKVDTNTVRRWLIHELKGEVPLF